MKTAEITLSFSSKVEGEDQKEAFFNEIVNSIDFDFEVESEKLVEIK